MKLDILREAEFTLCNHRSVYRSEALYCIESYPSEHIFFVQATSPFNKSHVPTGIALPPALTLALASTNVKHLCYSFFVVFFFYCLFFDLLGSKTPNVLIGLVDT